MQVSELPVARYKKAFLFLRNGERVRINNGQVIEKKGKKYFTSAEKSFSPETKVLRCEIKRRKK
jgi:hypothetical protein